MSWTPDRIDELTRLWNEGQSASAIGKQLGISKNAVVGKAHRLKLAARPSPIRKQEAGNATPQRKRSESLAMPPRSESSGEPAEGASQPTAQARPEDSAPEQATQPQAPKSRETDTTGAEPKGAVKSKAKAPPKTAEDHNPGAAERAAPAPSEQVLEAVNTRTSRAKPAPRPQPVTRTPKPAEAAPSNRTCQWPIGDPSQPDFHFCESPAAPGRPYCAEHCAMAYITRSKDSSKNKSSEAA